jgi:hypothetical protein
VDPNFQRKVWLCAWKAPSLSSSTVVLAYVWDDPQIIFEVQAGNSSVAVTTPVAQGSVFNNANHAGQLTPTTAGISQAYLDQNSIATTNTLALRIFGLSQKVALRRSSIAPETGSRVIPGSRFSPPHARWESYQGIAGQNQDRSGHHLGSIEAGIRSGYPRG